MRIRVILKQQSKDNVPTISTKASTPIFAPVPAGHIKPWISPLPKASGGFNRASTASMGIVFPLLTMAKSTVGALSPPLLPLLFSTRSDLAGAEQRRDGREKAHAFTSASHTHKEKKNQIAQTRVHAHTFTLTHTYARHLIQRGTTMRMCEKKENGEKSGCWKGNTFGLGAAAQMTHRGQ